MAPGKAAISKDWWTVDSQKRPELTKMVNLFEQGKVTKVEDLPQLLSAREAAPILKVHHKTASEMMRNREIKSMKLKGRIYTTPEWIADFLRKELRGNG